jgi:acylglycerol lipase
MDVKNYDGRTYFTGWAGLDLFFSEHPSQGPAKASVVIVHGYAEHSGRYSAVVDTLCREGFSVFLYDQRGHGRSEGVRADVLRFVDYVQDLSMFVDYVREQSNGRQVFLIAHSAGASTSALYAAGESVRIDGLVTTGIYVRDATEYDSWKVTIAKILVRFIPLMPIQEFDPARVAENPETCTDFQADPLVYQGATRVRMGMHFMTMESKLKPAMAGISVPLLILHGANDRSASVEGSRMLYEMTGSDDKRLEVLEGTGHAVLHDYGWSDTLRKVLEWLNARA